MQVRRGAGALRGRGALPDAPFRPDLFEGRILFQKLDGFTMIQCKAGIRVGPRDPVCGPHDRRPDRERGTGRPDRTRRA